MERIYIATIIISIQEHQILFDVTPFDEYNKALKYIKERLKHKYTKIIENEVDSAELQEDLESDKYFYKRYISKNGSEFIFTVEEKTFK